MITLARAVLDIAKSQADKASPREACGLLLGYDNTIAELCFCKNVTREDPHKNFELDPQFLINMQKETRDTKFNIMGVWHSHPNGRSTISDRDKERSLYTDWYWLVTATGSTASHALYHAGDDPHDLEPVEFMVA